MTGPLLAVNAGSSSLKFALYETDGPALGKRIARGLVDFRRAAPSLRLDDASGRSEEPAGPIAGPADPRLGDVLLQALERRYRLDAPVAVGHRIVHGGDAFVDPQPLDHAALGALEAFAPFAPGHQPANLAFVRSLAARWPGIPQIGCFDTAFHHAMPAVARRFALPRALEDAGLKRYGFHGLSYAAIHETLAERAPDLARGRVIVAHLGSGASLCAMENGRSVDTTMGLTAIDGLPMATRCGALDPGVVLHLIRERGLSADAVEHMLYAESGLLGLSGLSGDMRTLLDSDTPEAAAAIEHFTFRAAREIGALAASLGGLDALVFTGGIGENAPAIRAAIARRCGWLGVALDAAANDEGVDRIGHGPVEVWRLATDEERMIARLSLGRLHKPKSG